MKDIHSLNLQSATDDEMREAIKAHALDDLNAVKRRITPPDHLEYPEIFAWALKNLYSNEQKKGLWFDHGENEESFCRSCGLKDDTPIEKYIREKLISIREDLKTIDMRDFDECCDCPDHH